MADTKFMFFCKKLYVSCNFLMKMSTFVHFEVAEQKFIRIKTFKMTDTIWRVF